MSEITLADDIFSGFDRDALDPFEQGSTGGMVQLDQSNLSPVNYKTQIILSLFLPTAMLGINRFHAGRDAEGAGCLALALAVPIAASAGLLPSLVGKVSSRIAGLLPLISILQLCDGSYTDGDGKLIRQVVHLKPEEISPTDQKVALILSMLLGVFGVHQFYAGKPLKGIAMLFTLGGLGIWAVINIYQIATCGFRDGQGRVVCPDYIKEAYSPRVPQQFHTR